LVCVKPTAFKACFTGVVELFANASTKEACRLIAEVTRFTVTILITEAISFLAACPATFGFAICVCFAFSDTEGAL
tara:strand:- start:9047 stop:9274 length:228 start_codon:yes stop_codon:yes gene_type:complete